MKTPKIPTYGCHKQSGQARVYVNGRSLYLGPYGSEASRIAYGELVGKIIGGLPLDPFVTRKNAGTVPTKSTSITVSELCLAFMRYAEKHYVTANGKPSAEVACFKSSITPLVELYGHTPVDDFGPLELKAVRQKFIDRGWCRGFCNKCVNRLRLICKWGVENALVNVVTLHALQCVSSLKRGKCDAKDRPRREAVSDDVLDAVRPHLAQNHRDLFDLLRATGARPSELLGLSMENIDTSGAVWIADLDEHKNASRGLSRKLFFGPQSQMVLRRRPAVGKLFSVNRNRFSTIVKRACLEAGITPFVPYTLRHTKATELRDSMSIEAAQAVLGHAQPSMTARYSTKMDRLAIEAAARCG
ncbi:MAG: tyrosine-type recombinase/integrase [Planctomycetales bacterium]|nr:tyrosine-type recombinase/integrase [Planctomycetales bacterium]